jgi:glycosyl transferase family 87
LRRILREPALLLALALALTGLASAWDLGRRSPGLDFYQFWVVAQVAGRADVADVYGDEERARLGQEFIRRSFTDEDSERRRVAAEPWTVLEPTATPLLYTAFRPLSGGSYEDDYRAWRLLSLAALAAGLLALARRAGLDATTAALVLAFVGHLFQPLKAEIRVGNANQLQIGLLAAYLWLSSRGDRSRAQVAAGALLALTVVFKPNLLPLLPVLGACWFLRRRRRKLALQAVGLASGAVVAALLPLLTFGSLGCWPDWMAYLSALPPEKIPLRFGNVGPARLLFEVTTLDASVPLAAAALIAAMVALRRGARPGLEVPPPAAVEDLAAVGAGCLVYLLSSPMVWLHYMLLALPAALVLLRPPPGGQGASWRAALAVLALLGLAVDPATQAFGPGSPEYQATVTSLSLLLLFVLLCGEMSRWTLPPAEGGHTIAPGGAS